MNSQLTDLTPIRANVMVQMKARIARLKTIASIVIILSPLAGIGFGVANVITDNTMFGYLAIAAFAVMCVTSVGVVNWLDKLERELNKTPHEITGLIMHIGTARGETAVTFTDERCVVFPDYDDIRHTFLNNAMQRRKRVIVECHLDTDQRLYIGTGVPRFPHEC